MSPELAPGTALQAPPDPVYTAVFSGRRVELHEQSQTFRVSRAGIALGEFLLAHATEEELRGRVLDLGTGSGAIAILLRAMGATSVSATDVSRVAVETARRNELLNFAAPEIDFRHGDLFDTGGGASGRVFDMVVFNPPGWRTPSRALKSRLDGLACALEADAMFYGETLLLKFLLELPGRLAPGGRAIVGLNSLLGVRDVLQRLEDASAGTGRGIRHRVLHRVELPLLFYTDEWASVRGDLLQELADGAGRYGAQYVMRDQVLHWFYEITEFTVVDADALTR